MFSIVHPGFGPHVDAVSGYLVEALYEKPSRPEMLPLHAYHRPLSSYVNTLARAGLSVTRLVETPHDEAAYDGGVPGLLYARCAKTGG